MPLVPLSLYPTLYAAIKDAAEQAMILYNRGLDPLDKATNIEVGSDPFPKIKISVDCSKTASPIGNTAKPNDKTVVPEKAAELFGLAMAANLTPVLVKEFDAYIRTATVTTPPGVAVTTAGSAVAQTGVTTAPGIGIIS